jgi:hypothetical protein
MIELSILRACFKNAASCQGTKLLDQLRDPILPHTLSFAIVQIAWIG